MQDQKTRDVIIIWWGASWLFCSIFADKNLDKLILEKSDKVWSKILLSGWWRCNVTNIKLKPDEDYIWDNIQILHSIFHKFWNYDMINRLEERWLSTHQEKWWKIFLDCEKSNKLLDLLIKESKDNNTEIRNWEEVIDIEQNKDWFVVKTSNKKYTCKKVVVSSWWKTFPQIWATWFAWDIANKLWLQSNTAYPCLCGIETQQDLSWITGNSTNVEIWVSDWKKILYQSKWMLLFTHWWISGPVVFDVTLHVWKNLEDLSKWQIKLIFGVHSLTKKIAKFLGLKENENEVNLDIKSFRPWEEAKVTWWGIKLSQLDQKLQSKTIPWLYFIGEACDITGRTWGFNLQWAWSSGYFVGNYELKIKN